MVGAAQYRDDEIDWVLSAVVNKRKQSYIQNHFKERFGRSLNHNQIRYIKNKYGKDPRFNSPLVNTRAPRTVASPPSSDLGDNGIEEDEDAGSITTAGPSIQPTKLPLNSPQASNEEAVFKRRRSFHDEGDELERRLQHTAKTQRLNETDRQSIAPRMADTGNPSNGGPPRNTRLTTQLAQQQAFYQAYSSPLTKTAETNYARPFDPTQQQQQHQQRQTPVHVANSNTNWASVVPLSNSDMWNFGNSSSWISGQGTPATFTQNSLASGDLNYFNEDQTSTPFPSPVHADHRSPMLQGHLPTLLAQQFLPSMPVNPLYASNSQGQRQQQQQTSQQHQQQQSQTQAFSAASSQIRAVRRVSRHQSTVPTSTPSTQQPSPSFEEVPIEPASPPAAGMAPGTGWAALPYIPYEPSAFDLVAQPMGFPFENVLSTGLTATTSQVISQNLSKYAAEHGLSRATTSPADQAQPGSRNLNGTTRAVSSFELLNMIRQPLQYDVGGAAPHPPHPLSPHDHETQLPSAIPGSPSRFQVLADIDGLDDLNSTIDPRLLTEYHDVASSSTVPHTEPSYGVISPVQAPSELPGHGQS